ncbi:IS3 family transposase, partial [Klebsiella pneumoniae]|nr:IS3 family transposase [Klebsiella pneumoniae]
LSAEILVRRWLDVYNDAGAEGLLNIQCGRPGKMTKPKNIPPLTDKELEKLSPEELRAELRYLRAENAYLKKLKALVQSEKKWQKALIISELRHEHALRDLLRAAGMSRSTWYYNMNALKQG